ncbi:hypothetical protein DFW101_2797 [Solidesulfovibrio carbinoliphilus subsp. oakridgensis]|uniref:Conjugal transfer protein TraM n=1 Tax=Solidesulfovibrio carbinoliphilus subsp. oakridgensis TaxID=694327 RepID=G7QB59_9BACT|nr:hypothetical protein [Solidesulfovibrio carbinoliphilus]EHJ48801.1 hypothetical protein DFW101_2797 [Solidesulfovibrio carbinoliphilus subsp. oakridgensis]
MAPEAQVPDKADSGLEMPDGIGLSIEQVRTLLIQKHKTTMSDDDPMLMLVTINNAFLGDYDKLLGRHNKALTAYFESQAQKLLEAARQASEVASGVEIVQEACQKHANALHVSQSNQKWLSAIVVVSALLNVAVFVLGSLR